MTSVHEIKQTARGVVIEQIDRRTTQVGNELGRHAGTMRELSMSLRDRGQNATADLLDVAAERLTRASTYLTQTDGDGIIRDVETVARRRPVITAATGFIAGITAARLLKAGVAARFRTDKEDGTWTKTPISSEGR